MTSYPVTSVKTGDVLGVVVRSGNGYQALDHLGRVSRQSCFDEAVRAFVLDWSYGPVKVNDDTYAMKSE